MRATIGFLLIVCVGCGSHTPTAPTILTLPTTTPTPPTADPNAPRRFTITGNSSLTSIGQRSQLMATAVFADGMSKDITADAHWISRQPWIVTVSSGGLLTAV